MSTARSESELVALRKLAEQFAAGRKERPTTVHYLAAIAARPGTGADLLADRRLDAQAVLKAGRSFDEDTNDAPRKALASATEVAKRALHAQRSEPLGRGPRPAFPEPNGLHLLVALLADRRSAAHRALVQSGVDVSRLRTTALGVAFGAVTARRSTRSAEAVVVAATAVPTPVSSTPKPKPAKARTSSPPRSRGRGVAVPLMPPAPKPAVELTRPVRRRAVAPIRHVARAPSLPPLDAKAYPVLSSLGRDLVVAAASGDLPRVLHRELEVERTLDVLAKLQDNAPCLVGPSGVGKTAVAHGVAHRLVEMAVETGRPRRLVEISVSELIAGTATRGALAERIASIRSEVHRGEEDIVLFIDEIADLVAASDEATAELKLALARRELSVIATCTSSAYARIVEPEGTLSRRLVTIEVEPPKEEEAFFIARAVAERFSAHHGLPYDDEAIASAVSWSMRYITGRALPDKALSVLDLAGARRARRREGDRVQMEDVAHVVSELTEVPVERLLESDGERLLALEQLLEKRVVGHRDALHRIARHVRRNAAGLRGRRPIGSFLLLGPTGVGKTETAKALAGALFDSSDAMVRLDLSEFSESHSVARLLGSPPGYVGHEAGGQLTEAVRKRPYQVVLLDEIEKAHRDVLQSFLQVLDEGHMTDGRGRRVDFTNTVVIWTSNIGAEAARNARTARPVGFAAHSPKRTDEREAALAVAKATLPPELLNRFDEVLYYDPLTRDHVAEILTIVLGELETRLTDRGIGLNVDPEAFDVLVDVGFEPEFGARPLRRAVSRLVEAPLADAILRGDLRPGAVALVSADAEGSVTVDSVPGSERRASAG